MVTVVNRYAPDGSLSLLATLDPNPQQDTPFAARVDSRDRVFLLTRRVTTPALYQVIPGANRPVGPEASGALPFAASRACSSFS